MDVLFRTLVQSGASDLHLRSNEPPMLRLHGELARQDQPPLSAERLETMLLSIMTAKEIGEFREGRRHRLGVRDRRPGALPLQRGP